MASLKEGSATAVVHAALRDRIGRAELPPGEPLRQDRIAATFGVSHVPVREALSLLVCEGLATSHMNRGSVVSALSAEDARELAEYRGLLEAGLIRRAIPNLSRNDLAKAEATLDELDAATSLDRIVVLNATFHTILYARAERPFILRAIDSARLNLGRYLWLTWRNSDNAERSQAEHRRLLAHCKAGDEEAAGKLTLKHLRATGEQVARIITEQTRRRKPKQLP
jgi:DNA-binding GntR family transcriptional regulator